MASSTDFKKLYALYRIEGVKKGISIVQFCKSEDSVKNGADCYSKNGHAVTVLTWQS